MARLFSIAVLLTIAAIALGFFYYLGVVAGVAERGRVSPNPNVQGLVVLTGSGGERIAAAMALAESGVGERLLISGVNPAIPRSKIAEFWPGAPEKFECCVDLGVRARSTAENAAEAREWAQRHQMDTLAVVTSDYHIPRAMLEMRAQLPAVMITPIPVTSTYFNERGVPASARHWRLVATEYFKYIAVHVKNAIVFRNL